MPVTDKLKQCVALVCHKEGRRYKLAGSAFFVSMQVEGLDRIFVYAVTPKHVIESIIRRGIDGKSYMRVNFTSGRGSFLKVDVRQWRFHPTDPSVDVAVLPWVTPGDLLDFQYIPSEEFVTQELIESEEIGAGDEVFFPSVFVSHVEPKLNLPIVRSGRIAQIEEWPVRTKVMGDMEAYLAEVCSFGGLTGSPFFVRAPAPKKGKGRGRGKASPYRLLGLLRGPWDLPASDTDLIIEERPDKDNLNTGLVIVIPATRILEVLNQPELAEIREQAEEILGKGKSSSPPPETQPASESRSPS